MNGQKLQDMAEPKAACLLIGAVLKPSRPFGATRPRLSIQDVFGKTGDISRKSIIV
jgi:hypothetical protein